MTIDEIIEKEELKVDALLKSLAENTTSFAVEDFINDIIQQYYLSLVYAIGHMAKFTKADTRACGDIVALASVVFSAVSERTHPSEAPQAVPKLMADTLHVLARQFRAYESHHAHKGDIEKAESNASFAKLAETVVEMATGTKRPSVTQQQIEAAVNAAKSPDKRSQPNTAGPLSTVTLMAGVV